MPQCPECGALNSDSSSFCIRCGQTFAAAAPSPVPSLEAPPVGHDAGRILDEAAELYATGNLDEAAAACRAALDEDPNHVAARSLLGMVEEDRGNPAAALAEYEAVLRLAPERTAERERADRLRAQIRAQAADTYADETYDRKRVIALGVALAAGVLVLIIGALAVSRGGRSAPPPPAALAGMPGEPGAAFPEQARTDETRLGDESTTASLETGDGTLSGRGIGPPVAGPADQSASQPGRSATGGGTPPAIPDPLPLPPPTVERSPLELPQPPSQPQGATPSLAPARTAPSAPAPVAEPARGQVRIWMGEDDAPPPSAPAAGPSPPASGAERSEHRQARHATRSGAPAAAERVPVTTGSHATPAAGGASALRPPQSAPGSGAQPATRSGVGAAAEEVSQTRPLTTVGTSGADARRPTGGLPSRPESASPRPYDGGGGARSAPAPRPGAPSATTPTPPNTPAAPTTSAADLRARAQQAAAAGRTDEARRLYRNAIHGYQSEARANPGRAAANRSAIESVERAMDALDASR